MCHDLDSRPPIPPIAGAAVDGTRVELQSADGTRFAAFAARPEEPSGAAILILPDVRGLHPFYEELALRFAEAGIDALAIDYFGRTAGTTQRGSDFEHNPHVERTRYATLLADMRAGRDELGVRPHVRAVFSVGFCYGGRLAFLSAARPELGLSGVIGFYGVVAGKGRVDLPAPVELAAEVRCPILGLFGGDDPSIPPEAVADFDRRLGDAGIEHELVSYPGAPHSFFDRKAEDFADESADAWRRVLDFVRRNTPSG
jgi:carboxymethylenebutenolidase